MVANKKTSYNGNQNLKRVGVTLQYSKYEIEEYIKCSKDPLYFIENYVKIVSIDAGLQTFKPFQYQRDYLLALHNNQKILCTLSRQMGKTICTAAYLCWYMLFNSDKYIAIVSLKLSAAREVLSRIQLMYFNLPLWLQQGVIEFNKTSMELENGSKIMCAATSGTALTSKMVAFLYIDEAALIPNHIADEFFTSVFPTLSSGKTSRVVMTSTPRGIANTFYRFWKEAENGINGFATYHVPWNANPNRDNAWLEEQRRTLGELKWRREVLCEWQGSANTLISANSILSLPSKQALREDEKLKIFEEPIENHNYISIADVARGTENDYSTLITIDVSVRPFRVVCTYRCNSISTELFPDKIKGIGSYYNDSFVVVETNDMGESVVNTLYNELEYENVFKTSASTIDGWNKPDHLGLRTTVKTKRIGCEALKSLIESNQLEVNDINIISELSTFVAKRNSYSAESGSHDDLVMPLVLFGWLTRQLYFKDLIGVDRTNLLSSGISKVTEELLIMGVTKEEAEPPMTKQELEQIDPEFLWMFDSTHQVDYMNSFLDRLNGKEDRDRYNDY